MQEAVCCFVTMMSLENGRSNIGETAMLEESITFDFGLFIKSIIKMQ